jgi:hypothetical protein
VTPPQDGLAWLENAAMSEAAIKRKVDELIRLITSSPLTGQSFVGASPGIYQPDASSRGPNVNGSLDQLRLQVKYLLCDLEATRRENRYLRQMLETRHKRDLDDLKGDGPEAK